MQIYKGVGLGDSIDPEAVLLPGILGYGAGGWKVVQNECMVASGSETVLCAKKITVCVDSQIVCNGENVHFNYQFYSGQ
jgi:hypothetical protein